MCTFVSEGPSLYEYRNVQKSIVVGAGLWYGTRTTWHFSLSKAVRRDNTTMGFLPEFYLQKKTLCLPNVVGAVNLYITSLLSRSRGMRKYRLEISPIPNYRITRHREIRTFDKNVRIVRTNLISTVVCSNMHLIIKTQNVRILV